VLKYIVPVDGIKQTVSVVVLVHISEAILN